MSRYSRNMNALSIDENNSLQFKKACVLGCGGLGGHIIEMLGRLGVGHITAIDGDCFEESNLNRQLLSDTLSIGISKAEKAKERMKLVNPLIVVKPVYAFFDEKNAKELLNDHDVIIDALDNIRGRLLLEKTAEELDIPLIHGAIAGWYAQITTVFPGDRTLSRIYSTSDNKGIEKELGNPSFTPALAAAIQVSEAVKLLIGRGSLYRNKLLLVDLLNNDFDLVEI